MLKTEQKKKIVDSIFDGKDTNTYTYGNIFYDETNYTLPTTDTHIQIDATSHSRSLIVQKTYF
jgi:hypothetical protein